jgi:hypothetical protein
MPWPVTAVLLMLVQASIYGVVGALLGLVFDGLVLRKGSTGSRWGMALGVAYGVFDAAAMVDFL